MKITLLMLLAATLLSCKQDKLNNDTSLPVNNNIEVSINFPDTVIINQSNNGIVYFKSPLDTIITRFGDKKKSRYARFILTTTDNIDYGFEKARERVKDTFGALNNREIPFYRIKFTKTGTYFIDGIIDDIVLLDTSKIETDRYLLIRSQDRVTKKVFVIEKPEK